MTNPEEETERLSREEVDPGNRPPLKEGVEVGIEDLLSPFVLEAALLLFKMLRASLTFLGTEVGGCGGAEFGKDVGPVKK